MDNLTKYKYQTFAVNLARAWALVYVPAVFKPYRVDRILPQICTAYAEANRKHSLKQMQYRFAGIFETLSIRTRV